MPAPATGYVQAVEYAALLAYAERADLVVRMEQVIVSFVVAGTPRASVASPAGRPPPPA